jgi:hypothetical protein
VPDDHQQGDPVNDVPDADRTVPGDEAAPAVEATPAAEVEPAAAADDAAPQAAPEQVMDLLADHVPLALLMDLVTPDGPSSAEILQSEGLPDDAWWEPEDGTEEPADPAPGDGSVAPLGTDPASDDPAALD